MQQVRALGRMAKESHDEEERRLASDFRKACATGLMKAWQEELQEFALKGAEAEATSRHNLLRSIQRKQLVIPPTTAYGPQLAAAVETFEDDASVVGEPSHYRSVEEDPVGEPVRLSRLTAGGSQHVIGA